jgi:hypothetical protein
MYPEDGVAPGEPFQVVAVTDGEPFGVFTPPSLLAVETTRERPWTFIPRRSVAPRVLASFDQTLTTAVRRGPSREHRPRRSRTSRRARAGPSRRSSSDDDHDLVRLPGRVA